MTSSRSLLDYCPVPEIRGILLRSKWAAGKAVRAGLAVEGAYLNRYVTGEQRGRRPISSQQNASYFRGQDTRVSKYKSRCRRPQGGPILNAARLAESVWYCQYEKVMCLDPENCPLTLAAEIPMHPEAAPRHWHRLKGSLSFEHPDCPA
jgi:hypothetical protein